VRNPRIAVFQGYGGLYYWRCIARNGRTICDGSEGYASKSNAVRAAKRAAALMWYCGGRPEALRVEVVDA